MYQDPVSKPSLTEFNTKYSLATALVECHRFKMQHYNFLFNLGIVVVLLFALLFVLLVKYRGKPTEEEKIEREHKKKEYILSRIQHFQDARTKMSQGLITGLPSF
jgi:hypothetical protein